MNYQRCKPPILIKARERKRVLSLHWRISLKSRRVLTLSYALGRKKFLEKAQVRISGNNFGLTWRSSILSKRRTDRKLNMLSHAR